MTAGIGFVDALNLCGNRNCIFVDRLALAVQAESLCSATEVYVRMGPSGTIFVGAQSCFSAFKAQGVRGTWAFLFGFYRGLGM